ncbi:flavodoxin family protein [Sulfurospirillum sp.]|uniref:flavodoxin family protein n=1 Tax=Sulfurospirillum sp. TaxID=2053622 RepID=UPI002FDDE0F9
MKVLLVNGSSNKKGSTFNALSMVEKSLKTEGIESEVIQVGNTPIRDCSGCMGCYTQTPGLCVFKDDMINDIIYKAEKSDGFIFGSPVYYAHPTGRILSLLDRLFFAGRHAFAYKPGSAVVVARRSGTTSSFDVLNKYFTINNMPIVSSQYWNNIYAKHPEDLEYDLEGQQTLSLLGKNMAWLLKCIEIGKNNGVNIPQNESRIFTNFINHNKDANPSVRAH